MNLPSETFRAGRHIRPWVNAADASFLLSHVDYAYTALYTHNFQVFQGITRKIRLGYPRADIEQVLREKNSFILC